MEFHEYLQLLAKQAGVKQVHAVAATGASKAGVNHWWQGNNVPTGMFAIKLAKLIMVEPEDLIAATEGSVEKLDKYIRTDNTGRAIRLKPKRVLKNKGLERQLPLLNSFQSLDPAKSIAAGDFIDLFPVGNMICSDCSFFCVVDDDSMHKPGHARSLQKGITVLVDPNEQPRPGDVVLAAFSAEGKAVPRIFKDMGDGRYGLIPLNDYYPANHDAQIVGVVMGFYSQFRGTSDAG